MGDLTRPREYSRGPLGVAIGGGCRDAAGDAFSACP